MAKFKGALPRYHHPIGFGGRVTTKPKLKRNPIETLRAPWKVKRGEDDTSESPSWNIVNNIYANDPNKMHRSLVLIEVRPLPKPEGSFIGYGDGEGAEITVYFAETFRFRDHYDKIEGLTSDNYQGLETAVEWIREHWSRRVSGEVEDMYPDAGKKSSIAPEDEDGPYGYRRVLEDFMNGNQDPLRDESGYRLPWDALPHTTPVVVHVPGDKPWVTTLNAARLGVAEAEVYEEIYGQALGRKEYEETNTDAVSDYPENFFEKPAHEILRGDMYAVGANGHGWVRRDFIYGIGSGQAPYEARTKLLQLVKDCENSDTNPTGKMQDLRRFVNEAVKYSDIWCLSDPNDSRRPDPTADFVFMDYQTEDLVEDQLDTPVVERVRAMSPAAVARISEALDRVDVRYEPDDHDDLIYIGDVNAHWLFSIDVDSIIEEMYGEWQDLDPNSYEDEDEDEDDSD